MTRWLYISLPYATFALCIRDGRVTMGPPIARWTRGKSEAEVVRFYTRKGAEILDLDEMERVGAGHEY